MKVCISLRDKVGSDLRAESLRSEPRWERLALEACTRNPEVTDIFTLGFEWREGTSFTPKYRGFLNNSVASETILLMQDCNTSVLGSFGFKAAVINIFHGPWIGQKDEIWNLTRRLGNRVFFVLGHPRLYRDEMGFSFDVAKRDPSVVRAAADSHLRNFSTTDRILFLPVPWIPESCYADRFDKKNLLWPCRILYMGQVFDSFTVDWALKELIKDQSLSLNILTGFEKDNSNAKDYVNGNVISIAGNINDYFWRAEKMQKYLSIRSRVHLHYAMSWRDILAINAESRLMLFHGKQYGGPPLEAAMYGIPFIGVYNGGALADCQDYLYTVYDHEVAAIFDRLFTDHNYYNDIAKKYHDYAVGMYSFDNFNTTLNTILKERGLL